MTFRDAQRRRAARFRGDRPIGRWQTPQGRWIDVAWIVDPALADETLWAPIRAQLLDHFARDRIAWHEEDATWYGHAGGPSPNLMDSQIFCLNFWFGVDVGAALRRAGLDAHEVVDLEPEWIGHDNPLGERGRPRRGKYATSADLRIRYRDGDGALHAALIESKWSESYTDTSLRFSRSGTDRATIYAPSYDADWSWFAGGAPQDHMVDPFDQLMRLCLLGASMAHRQEDGVQQVTVLDCCPRANQALWGPLEAADFGRNLEDPARFRLVAYEDLFQVGGAPGWSAYMSDRYGL